MHHNTKEIRFQTQENGCIIVTSHKPNKDGYIRIRIDKKMKMLHRHIYEQRNGEIPKGMVIRHKCDNPSCVNPHHLELGTHAENMNDMKMRNRANRMIGEKHWKSSLTQDQVIDIFKSSEPRKSLAEKFGVSLNTIHKIKTKQTWSAITEKL